MLPGRRPPRADAQTGNWPTLPPPFTPPLQPQRQITCCGNEQTTTGQVFLLVQPPILMLESIMHGLRRVEPLDVPMHQPEILADLQGDPVVV